MPVENDPLVPLPYGPHEVALVDDQYTVVPLAYPIDDGDDHTDTVGGGTHTEPFHAVPEVHDEEILS